VAGQRIKNIIETQFTEKGAKNVAQKTDQIGKAQTRLGQSSASAGRSFSAQAQGLGGIVGVYAAAAANVFALTAAFTALNRAAQFETILRGTEQLANAVGTDAESVVKSLKSVTAGQLSIIEAATQANLALSAGFNIDQIEQLGSVALKASRALGRNLTDSFQRITRGAIKLEPELLDEIGIFTRIEPAVEAYAASINKSASSLTRFEKRQAFVTQVIKDGEAAFSDITNTSETTQEVFEKLVANFSDLAIQVGGVLANALVPFAAFLDQNLGTRLALLGSVGLLVFGRLAGAIRGFATEGLVTLGTKLTGVAAQFGLTTKKALEFAAAGTAAQASFVGGGALPGAGRAYGAELKRELGEGLTTRQALVAQKEIPNLQKNEINLQKAINQNLKEGLISQKEATAEIGKSEIRKAALLKTENLITTQLAAQGGLSKVLATGLNFAAAAAAKLATFLSLALAAFNVVAIALVGLQLVGTLFDVDLLGKVTNAFKELTAESRRTKEGLEGITENIKSTDDAFKSLTRNIGGSTAQKMIAFNDASELTGLTQAGLRNNIRNARIELANYERAQYKASLSEEERAEAIKKVERELRANLVAQKLVSEETKRSALLVGTLAETSDVSAKSLSEASNKGLLKFDEATKSVILQLESGSLAIGKFDDDTITLKEDINLGAAVAADFANKLENLRKKLANGTISADKAGTAFGVLANQGEKAAKSLEANDFADGAALIRKNVELARGSTGKLVEQIVALNQFGKQLSKTFSGAFKAVDEAVTSGRFNAFDGSFAKTQEEQDRNRVTLNAEIVKQFREQKKEFEDLVALGEITKEQSALFRERQDAANKIIKGTAGESLQLVFTLEKQRMAEEKKLEALKNQLKIQKQQNKISQIGLDIATQQTNLSIQKNEQALILKIKENESKLIVEQTKNQDKQLDSSKTLLGIEQQRATALAKQADAQRKLKDARENAALAIKKGQADRQVSISELRGVNNPQEMSALRIKAAEAATNLELAAIEQRRQAAIDDYVNQIQAIDDRNALLAKEFEIENQKRKNAEAVIRREQDIAEIKTANALKNNEAEFNILVSKGQQIAQQFELAELQAKLAKDQKISDLKILEDNAKLVVERIAAEKALLKGNETVVNGLIKAANLIKDGNLQEISVDTTGINTGNIDSIISNLGKQATKTEDIYKEQTKAAEITRDTAIQGLAASIDKNATDKVAIQNQAAATFKLNEAKLKGLQDERSIAQTILDEKISLSNLEKDAVADTLILQMQKAGIDRQTAITALEYAKQEERYKLSAQFRLDQALSNSLGIVEGSFTNAFMNLNEQLINGTLTMDSIGNTFRDMLGGMMKAIQQEVFATTIAKPVAAGISGFIGSLFAGGGPVHMAGGGVMRRDRVHAMLEPGEFVMRKEAVKRIGMDQLQMMNSAIPGGKMEMIRGQPHMQAYITPGEASILKKLGGSGETYKGLPAFPEPGMGGPSDDRAGSGNTSGPSGGGFGYGHHDMAASDPGQVGGHVGNSGGTSSSAVTAGQVQAAMDRSRATGRTVGIVDALDSKPDRDERAAQMSREQHDYAQEVAERAAAKDRSTSGKKALAFAINALVGSIPGVGPAMSISSAVSGKSLGGGLTGEEPPGIGDLFAAGGLVHMAQGGRVNQVRDRVPALLEPGEFVIRKPMAKAIGGKALGAMNATGSVSPGNVSVNINNQGSPKGATVSAPRMNGDKMIIDVITRDLRNNGSIRKSLRGGNY